MKPLITAIVPPSDAMLREKLGLKAAQYKKRSTHKRNPDGLADAHKSAVLRYVMSSSDPEVSVTKLEPVIKKKLGDKFTEGLFTDAVQICNDYVNLHHDQYIGPETLPVVETFKVINVIVKLRDIEERRINKERWNVLSYTVKEHLVERLRNKAIEGSSMFRPRIEKESFEFRVRWRLMARVPFTREEIGIHNVILHFEEDVSKSPKEVS